MVSGLDSALGLRCVRQTDFFVTAPGKPLLRRQIPGQKSLQVTRGTATGLRATAPVRPQPQAGIQAPQAQRLEHRERLRRQLAAPHRIVRLPSFTTATRETPSATVNADASPRTFNRWSLRWYSVPISTTQPEAQLSWFGQLLANRTKSRRTYAPQNASTIGPLLTLSIAWYAL
jgi:hypothetical protein